MEEKKIRKLKVDGGPDFVRRVAVWLGTLSALESHWVKLDTSSTNSLSGMYAGLPANLNIETSLPEDEFLRRIAEKFPRETKACRFVAG